MKAVPADPHRFGVVMVCDVEPRAIPAWLATQRTVMPLPSGHRAHKAPLVRASQEVRRFERVQHVSRREWIDVQAPRDVAGS